MSSGLLRAVVPEQDLPDFVLFGDGSFGYRVRYRIISEDANRRSHYSPIYSVRPNYIFERPEGANLEDIDVVRRRRYVNIFWAPVSIRDRVSNNFIRNVGSYDVWVNWSGASDEGVWVPADRADGPLIGFIVPSSYKLSNGNTVNQEPTRLSVEIYVRATPQSREYSTLLVYKSDNEDISIDPGPPPI